MTPKTQTVKFKRGTNIGQLTEKFKCCRLPLKRKCEKCQKERCIELCCGKHALKDFR